ncbi:MAG: SWIM zinc finger family protein [Chloroflexota bacterium]
MTNIHPLTEGDIRAGASGQSFERGYDYYQRGAVTDLIRRGGRLTASVEGSEYEPYQVQVTLTDGGIAGADCTCPYDWGGYCKHIVATLLFYVHNQTEVEVRPELSTLLAGLNEGQLRQLILDAAEEHPALVETFEEGIERVQSTPPSPAAGSAAAPIPLDVEAIRRAIRKDFRHAGRPDQYDYYDEDEGLIYPDEMLDPHFDKIQALLDAGAPQPAVSIITAVIEEWIEGVSDLEEWVHEVNEDVLGEATVTIGARLAEVLLSLDLTPDERRDWQKRIGQWDKALDGLDIAKSAVRQGWDYPPLVKVLQGEIANQGDWEGEAPDYADELTLARLRVLERQGRYQEYIYLAEAEGQNSLYVNMLARTGRTAEALAKAKTYLNEPGPVLSLALTFANQGDLTSALVIAGYGLNLGTPPGRLELAQWTRDQAERAGDMALALQAAEAAFTSRASLANYQVVQRLAGDQWPAVRPRLLESLTQAWRVTDKVDIYLHEKMLVEAMQAVDKQGFSYGDDLRRVVEATQNSHPDWGIRKCKGQAEQIMDAGKASEYATAASWLRLAHNIYKLHGRLTEWRAYQDTLLEKHHRKYKLAPLLRAIQ